jgi:hypothetical protein
MREYNEIKKIKINRRHVYLSMTMSILTANQVKEYPTCDIPPCLQCIQLKLWMLR